MALLVAAGCTPGQSGSAPPVAVSAPARTRVTIGTGGQEQFIYLPLTLAKQLGYFEQAGLDAEIVNFPGGAKALEALVGGGVDLVVGFYDHTIQTQTKGIGLNMVVLYDRYPGIVMLVESGSADRIQGVADLRGQSVGVTSFGSSTHFVLNYLLTRAGISPDAVGVVQIGTGSSSAAALEGGKVPVGMFLDPTATRLVQSGRARILWDTRSEKDTVAAFGGPYLAGGMYTLAEFLASNPNTVQAGVTASVRTLRWIQSHPAEEIADRMPAEFYGGENALYVESLRASLPLFSPDGMISRQAAESVLSVLKLSDPDVGNAAAIGLGATYTTRFVEEASRSID